MRIKIFLAYIFTTKLFLTCDLNLKLFIKGICIEFNNVRMSMRSRLSHRAVRGNFYSSCTLREQKKSSH